MPQLNKKWISVADKKLFSDLEKNVSNLHDLFNGNVIMNKKSTSVITRYKRCQISINKLKNAWHSPEEYEGIVSDDSIIMHFDEIKLLQNIIKAILDKIEKKLK